MNKQLRIEYSQITNQTLHSFFTNGSDVSVLNISCLWLTIYLNSVQNIHQLQYNTQSACILKWYDCLNINELL